MTYSKETENQQAWLYDNGFFDKGTSRKRAVDGLAGNMTNAAMQRAQAAGWTYNNGQWSKAKETKPTLISRLFGQRNTAPKDSTYTAWTPRGTQGSIKGKNKAQFFDESKNDWVDTEQCAAWANAALRQYKDAADSTVYNGYHITGNAWTRLNSGKGTRMLFSGYDGLDYNPEDEQWAQARADNDAWLAAEAQKAGSGKVTDAMKQVFAASDARNFQAADNFKNNFNTDSLDKNKTYLVNMYYKGSPNRATAWFDAKGGTTGTHTGNLYWDANRNSWRVAHNIHGKVYDDDFSKALGSGRSYGITALSEVRRRSDKSGLIGGISRLGYDIGLWHNGGKLIPRNTNN